MKSILITGGTGSFGRAFTQRLLQTNVGVIRVLSRDWHRQKEMEIECGNDRRLRFFIGDVRDRDRLRDAMEDIEVVVHAAAIKGIDACNYNPNEAVKTHVIGAMNATIAAKAAGVKKVIYLSTDKAFAPISIYGSTKLDGEKIILGANETRGGKGPRYAVTRYGNVWGSRGSVIPKWQGLLAVGKHIEITDPECTRFFMRMGEAIDLVLETIDRMPTEVAVPRLPAYRLGDIPIAMGVNPRRVDVVGLGEFEKRHESMSKDQCSLTAPRMSVEELKAVIDGSRMAPSENMKLAAG